MSISTGGESLLAPLERGESETYFEFVARLQRHIEDNPALKQAYQRGYDDCEAGYEVDNDL